MNRPPRFDAGSASNLPFLSFSKPESNLADDSRKAVGRDIARYYLHTAHACGSRSVADFDFLAIFAPPKGTRTAVI